MNARSSSLGENPALYIANTTEDPVPGLVRNGDPSTALADPTVHGVGGSLGKQRDQPWVLDHAGTERTAPRGIRRHSRLGLRRSVPLDFENNAVGTDESGTAEIRVER